VDFLRSAAIRDAECNYCMDCVVDCPKPNVLALRGPRWRFSHAAYAAMLVAGLFVLIGASRLAGQWQTKPRAVAFTDARGEPDPENIRGWMTLEEISAGYGVPLAALYREAGLPARVPASARLNEIATKYNLKFEPVKVREIVRARLEGVKPEAAPPEVAQPEVKGFMTLGEIALKTGVPKEYLLRALGLPATIDSRAPVREWLHPQGKSIQDLRDAVAQYWKAKGR
jgi:hypothetical protein